MGTLLAVAGMLLVVQGDVRPAPRGMMFRGLADVVLLVHLVFVVFVALGGLLVLRWPRLAWVHVPVALYGALIEFVGFICPLTPLENAFRKRGGEAGYEGGFVEHYITAVLYPSGLTREIQIAVGIGVLALNAVIYGIVLRRRRLAKRVTHA
jgi:hypothetical protein